MNRTFIKTTFINNGRNKVEKYYKGGKLHRDDGPAHIFYYEDGTLSIEKYWTNGEICRNKTLSGYGPTFISYYESGVKRKEEFRIEKNILHRLTGPAVIRYYESGEKNSIEF